KRRNDGAAVAAHALLCLGEIERDVVQPGVSGEGFLLPASQVRHPPWLLQVEDLDRETVGLAFQDRHLTPAHHKDSLQLRPFGTRNPFRGTPVKRRTTKIIL